MPIPMIVFLTVPVQLINSIWVVVKTEGGEASLVDRVDPVDIIQLCEELVNIVPDADIKVTLPMLARVAILVRDKIFIYMYELMGSTSARSSLRFRAAPSSGRRWTSSSQACARRLMRLVSPSVYQFPSAFISAHQFHRNIAKVLKNDCRQYGSPDLAVFN
jgi:hypothetical protein